MVMLMVYQIEQFTCSPGDDDDHGNDDHDDQERVADKTVPQILTFLSSISMPFYLLHQQVDDDDDDHAGDHHQDHD